MMENMAELSDEQIVELQNEIISTFETVESEEPTPQTVEAMTSLADMLDSVRSEVKRREVQAEELAAQVTEASARVHGEDVSEEAAIDQETEETTDMEETPEGTPEEEAKDMVEGEAETPEEAKKKDEEKPVMASAESDEVEESTAAEEVAELSTEEPVELSVEEDVDVPAVEETTETLIDAPVEVQEENVEAPVTASIDAQDVTPEVPADRRLTSDATAVPVAITAGADIPGLTAGSELSSMSDVADAFAKRLHGLRRVNGGDGEQHIVASFSTAYPDSVQLGSDAEANMRKIDAVTEPQALVASYGYQSPFAVRYDIFGLGSNVRPIRDSLPTFQTDRGGIRFIVPPSLAGASAATYDAAVGTWTNVADCTLASSVASTTKGTLIVAAATETTAVADAITLQLQFGNLATRAYPELISRHNELALIQHAREAEAALFSKIVTASNAATSTNVLGVGVDFLLQVGRASAHYRGRHRMAEDAPLRVIAPFWVKSAIRADFALQMPGDAKLAVTDAEIDSYLAARHVNVSWTMDVSTGSFATINNTWQDDSSGALKGFANTFDWVMFAEGTFLFLDGGTLDLGIIRDSTLVGTNDYKMFVETFEGIAKVGVESLKVTSTINVNGARAALRDTFGASASSTIEFQS